MKNLLRVAAYFSVAALTITGSHAQTKKGAHPLDWPHPRKEIVQFPVLDKHDLYSEDHTADVVAVESVFSAYATANDSHNGPLAASLFTEDAIVHFVWNNKGTLVPTFGINPYDTPDGPNGSGCDLHGRKEVAAYFGFNRTAKMAPEHKNGLAFPDGGHHVATNKMVKISDDGQRAMLTATWLTARTVPKEGARLNGTGMYRIFFKKTADGWLINEFYGVNEKPSTTTQCDINGPLPRPQ